MEDLVSRLRKRAEIRRQIPSRKSVQEGEPDRLANLLEEAAKEIEDLNTTLVEVEELLEGRILEVQKLQAQVELLENKQQ